MALKKKTSKPKKSSNDGLIKAIRDDLLNSIKPLFKKQRKQSENRDVEVDQRLTALHQEIGHKALAVKNDIIQSIAPMFEDIQERFKKTDERITNEIRQVIVLIDQVRLEIKNAMTPS